MAPKIVIVYVVSASASPKILNETKDLSKNLLCLLSFAFVEVGGVPAFFEVVSGDISHITCLVETRYLRNL